MRVSHKNYLL